MVARAQHNGRVTVAAKGVVITRESAQVLLDILNQTTVAVGNANFAVLAAQIGHAKTELTEGLGLPALQVSAEPGS